MTVKLTSKRPDEELDGLQPSGLRSAGQIVARSEKQLAKVREAWRLARAASGDAK